MTWRILKVLTCISGLSMTLSASTLDVNICHGCNISQALQPLTQMPLEQLRHQAQAITVKVISKEFLGSGILLGKQGKVYTVLTNAHVLRAGNPPYRIQTADGRMYTANLPQKIRFQGHDLAILQFKSSSYIYGVAVLGASPNVGDQVFATGFPFAQEGTKENRLMFTTGKVSLVLDKALEGGYQVGYTNNIAKGMSGGPLLNRRGEVVGINGLHAYPLWDAPSVFIDGLEADERLHQMINRLSWAVPMDKVVKMIPKAVNYRFSGVK